ncbi:MAG: DUF1549 domain-containing protein, partial [Pirellulaceae bacterium]|nr:DUF1549 domain-containing protein [Pirellulaceae bacterium]
MSRPHLERLAMYKVASILIAFSLASVCHAVEPMLSEPWKRDGFATQRFEINGTGTRNNPLRRQLSEPFSGDEIFVRYRIRYDRHSIDTPTENDGEFFVLWMDDSEGNDASTHSAGVPNLGIHVLEDENRFMIRFGPGGQKFADKLTGDREYLVVGRLWKSVPGPREAFDQLDLWVDPQNGAEFKPDASTSSAKSIQQVRWIGFSTGAKTESSDKIEVWDIDIAGSWNAILKLPLPTRPDKPVIPRQPTVQFAQDVYPILKARCFECHAGDEAIEGVRLDVLDEAINQTAPRDAIESRLYQLAAQGKMPPEGDKLSQQELTVLRAWIDEGMDWDEGLLPAPIPVTDHWAFQPIKRPNVPVVKDVDWVRTAVDAFVKRKHEELGLTHAAQAAPHTLGRRLSLDLLGLPPVDNESQSMDGLLNRPEYGQRWARHWLDVARWAESNGHQHNRNR